MCEFSSVLLQNLRREERRKNIKIKYVFVDTDKIGSVMQYLSCALSKSRVSIL